MKYIIMCGGEYKRWTIPRQLLEIDGEPIVARTIRLLKKCGVNDIAISSNNPVFEKFGVPVLKHDNNWEVYLDGKRLASNGSWLNAFYLTDYPVCYLMGDVVFSLNAIKTIVETETTDIQFFASAPPFAKEYFKKHAEPFAFKVVNTVRFKRAIDKAKEYEKKKLFLRNPIAWELWQVIENSPLNFIFYGNYVAINDYTCDIDTETDLQKFKDIDTRC